MKDGESAAAGRRFCGVVAMLNLLEVCKEEQIVKV